MAEAFYNSLSKTNDGASAGLQPAVSVNPDVVTVMKEVGIDLSDAVPKYLTDEMAASADMLVTMGCGAVCPSIPSLKREDWPLIDPKGQPIEEVRKIRDDVKSRVADLLSRLADA